MASFRRSTVRRLFTVLLIAVALLVVVLVALIGFGVLVLPAHSSAPVTISSVHLVIDQGVTSTGQPWLGPSSINYTSAEGYPLQVSSGQTWSVAWTFINFDDAAHSITLVTPSAPFAKPTTQPSLPYNVLAGDEGALSIILTAPSTPGVSYAVTVTVVVGTLIG